MQSTASASVREFVAIPSWRDARILVPRQPALASAALRRARRGVTRRDRITTLAAAVALRCGLGRLVGDVRSVEAGEGSIEDALARMVGSPVVPAVFLGPPRANRKPVIQVMTPAGRLLGVAKLGTSDLSDRLVGDEADHLEMLAGLGLEHTIHPVLIGRCSWAGHPLAIQSPLPIHEQDAGDDRRVRVQVMSEIARAGGTQTMPWIDSAHRQRLLERLGRVDDLDVRQALTRVLDLGVDENAELEIGAWHGDLSAWNMAVTREGRAMVWDWERYATGVPVGFDALHYDFTPLLKRKPAERARAAIDLWEGASEALDGLGTDRAAARTICALYLVEIASRYAVDGQARTGVAGGDVIAWLTPLVHALEEGTHGRAR